ncbi:class I adenylate-forming enzyme family protein [Bailinhaonella thermotolerans]|nr:class I adenylate-forming enzyme family protein [Bailinhaonella thermotolerans]
MATGATPRGSGAQGGPGLSVVAGPPLAAISHLLDGPRIDHLLAHAAEEVPDRTALRSPYGDLTFAELDEAATGCARALRAVLGGGGSVVALAMVLDPAFAVAFYGISRSGNRSALVNPLLREDGLVHVLRACAARVAIVPPEVWRRLSAVADRLPDLELAVLTARDAGSEGAEAPPTLGELAGEAAGGPPPRARADETDVACVAFTSGTTGAAKGARLTHRNLTVNAAQTVHGHRLGGTSVLFNFLPTFHLVHLNIGVLARAVHVLHPDGDVAGAVEAADAARATHFYSLPMRLARLAADPRLPGLSAPALRVILSGGSALAPDTADVLSQQFGVPVVQGYGLAETSPCTHLSDLDRPRAGSCGVPAPGTECRIVDLGDGAVVPLGVDGEVQVRGPQLMSGYLGRDLALDVDAEGWFATGDVGRCDADGSLFLVDRIKDVFKCDNWLVSPTQIERVLLRHPDVADCAVVDLPDEFSGAVAYGVVVPRGGTADAEALMAYVNDRSPYYEHLRHVELVDELPKTGTGKVRRQELRERLRSRGRIG